MIKRLPATRIKTKFAAVTIIILLALAVKLQKFVALLATINGVAKTEKSVGLLQVNAQPQKNVKIKQRNAMMNQRKLVAVLKGVAFVAKALNNAAPTIKINGVALVILNAGIVKADVTMLQSAMMEKQNATLKAVKRAAVQEKQVAPAVKKVIVVVQQPQTNGVANLIVNVERNQESAQTERNVMTKKLNAMMEGKLAVVLEKTTAFVVREKNFVVMELGEKKQVVAVGVVQKMESAEQRVVIAVLILPILLILLGQTNAQTERLNAVLESKFVVVQGKLTVYAVNVGKSVAIQEKISGVVIPVEFVEKQMEAVERTAQNVMME